MREHSRIYGGRVDVDRVDKISLLLILAGCVAAALLLKPVVSAFLHIVSIPFKEKAAAKKAKAMRGKGEAEDQVRVRQTDIEDSMSSEDRMQRRRAEELVRNGKVLEAAQILESIRFQRRAIDILEAAGYIDEAVGVLIRLNAAHRAPVVYERNGHLAKAADYYHQLEKFDKAGEIYLKLAGEDPSYYDKASDALEKAGQIDDLLRALTPSLKTEKIMTVCLKHGRYQNLGTYMIDPINALNIFQKLSDDQRSRLIHNVPMTTQMVQTFANWVRLLPFEQLKANVLLRTAEDTAQASFFWKALSQNSRAELIKTLTSHTKVFGEHCVRSHAEALKKNEQWQGIFNLYFALNLYKDIAKTYVELGDLKSCRNWVERLGHEELTAKFDKLFSTENPPWSRTAYAAAWEIVAGMPDDQSGDVPEDLTDDPTPEGVEAEDGNPPMNLVS